MSHQGTREARCSAEVSCGTHRGLCVADRRATIAPRPRGTRHVSPDDYSPEVPPTPGTGERVDDTPQAERGRPCRAVSRTKRPRNRACSPVILRETRRVARWAQRASQGVFGLPRLQASWRVHTRRRNTMATMHDREDRHMANKGRGIFLVYV